MIKVGRVSWLVLSFVLVAFFLFGKQFVILWVGAEYEISWLIALIIMIAYTVPLVQAFGNSILEAKNRLAFKAILYLISLALGAVLGAFLAVEYKEVGMILGIAVAWLVAQNVLNWYYHKRIGLKIGLFFLELSRGIVPVLMVVGLAGLGIDHFITLEGWFGFLVKTSLFGLLFTIAMYQFGMNPYEKELLLDMKRKLSQTFKR